MTGERMFRERGTPRSDRLDIWVCEPRAAMTVVSLHGEVDAASSGALEAGLEEAVQAGSRVIVLDLRGVEFLDSNGIRVMLRGQKLANASGHTLLIVAGSTAIQRTLALFGVRHRFHVIDDIGPLLDD